MTAPNLDAFGPGSGSGHGDEGLVHAVYFSSVEIDDADDKSIMPAMSIGFSRRRQMTPVVRFEDIFNTRFQAS